MLIKSSRFARRSNCADGRIGRLPLYVESELPTLTKLAGMCNLVKVMGEAESSFLVQSLVKAPEMEKVRMSD